MPLYRLLLEKRCSKVCVQDSLERKKDKVFMRLFLRNQWAHKTKLSEGKRVLTRLLSTWGFVEGA